MNIGLNMNWLHLCSQSVLLSSTLLFCSATYADHADVLFSCSAEMGGNATVPSAPSEMFSLSGHIPGCSGGLGGMVTASDGDGQQGGTAQSLAGGHFWNFTQYPAKQNSIEIQFSGSLQAYAAAGTYIPGILSAQSDATYRNTLMLSGLSGVSWAYESWIVVHSSANSHVEFGLTQQIFEIEPAVVVDSRSSGLFVGDSFSVTIQSYAEALAVATDGNPDVDAQGADFFYMFRMTAIPVDEQATWIYSVLGLIVLRRRFRGKVL